MVRKNKVGWEEGCAHAARWGAKISAAADPSYGASTYAKELRRKNRRAIVRSNLGVVGERESGRPERGVIQKQVVRIFFADFFCVFASVHAMMTRSPANGKQTNGWEWLHRWQQGSCSKFASRNQGRIHARSQRWATEAVCVRGKGQSKRRQRQGLALRGWGVLASRSAVVFFFGAFDMQKSSVPPARTPMCKIGKVNFLTRGALYRLLTPGQKI